MKRITAVIIIVLVFSIFMACGDALAADWMSWDERNTELNYYAMALLIADMGQTLHIAGNPAHHTENNNYLGKHPSKTKVRQHFGWSYILVAGATFVLPKGWSHSFQNIVIFTEFCIVSKNVYTSVSFEF